MTLALASRRAALTPPFVRNELWRRARAVPTLDLRFAENKSLTDAVTGQSLVTFTRASRGTYVDSEGVIRTAVTNLLLQSEDFSTTWTSSNLTTTIDQIAAPTGAATADLITGNAGTSIKRLRQNISTTSLGPWTFSVWLKGGTAASALVALFDSSVDGVNNVRTTLTFSTGAISSASAAGTATSASASVQSFGNGWYRVSITGTFVTALTSVWAEIWLDGFTTTPNETSFYAWGAQLEESSTAGEYVKTTSSISGAARFDHDPTTGESLGLLVEESRTNSIRNNTMVGAVAGTPGTLPTNWLISQATGNLTTREIVGIGIENGIAYIDVRFVTSGSFTASVFADSSTAIAASNGQTWTTSFYVKLVGGSLTNVTFQTSIVENDSSGNFLAGADSAAFIPTTAALTTQRVTQTRTNTNASTAHERSRVRFNFSGAGDITLRIGLPQLEQGAFSTSVIPTTTAAVTRAADVASITTAGGNIRSLFTSFRSPASGTRPVVSLDDNTANERIEILTSGTDPKLLVTDGGSAVADLDGGTVTANVSARIAARFNTDNYGISINGGASQLDTSGALPAVDRIRIGSNQAGGYLSGAIARITGWDTLLANLPPITL